MSNRATASFLALMTPTETFGRGAAALPPQSIVHVEFLRDSPELLSGEREDDEPDDEADGGQNHRSPDDKPDD